MIDYNPEVGMVEVAGGIEADAEPFQRISWTNPTADWDIIDKIMDIIVQRRPPPP